MGRGQKSLSFHKNKYDVCIMIMHDNKNFPRIKLKVPIFKTISLISDLRCPVFPVGHTVLATAPSIPNPCPRGGKNGTPHKQTYSKETAALFPVNAKLFIGFSFSGDKCLYTN